MWVFSDVGFMLGCLAFWPEVVTGEINERSANLCRRESKKLTSRFRLDITQRPMQSHHGTLEDIVGLFPAAQARIVAEHLSR